MPDARADRRPLAASYFVVQALAVTAWWVGLVVSPPFRLHFSVYDAPITSLGAFAPGDLVCIAAGSIVVALRHERRWGNPLAWAVTGAMVYAAAYAIAAAVLGAAPPWGALLMLPGAIASVTAAAVLTRRADADAVS